MTIQQNKFYTSISKHYHEIFPYNQAQLQFINRQSGGLKGKKIIDVGCATGELAFQLADAGAEVTGIDLNEDLLNQAKLTKKSDGLSFRKTDMLEISDVFPNNQFDCVICFGNTLVHLPSLDLIQSMLDGVYDVLKPGGMFLLQILNYDYIVEKNITQLPVIESENIRFIRSYKIEKNHLHVHFNTRLEIKNTGEIIENETLLLALRSGQLRELCEIAGFEELEFFASFKEDSFGGNHMPLVAKVRKPG